MSTLTLKWQYALISSIASTTQKIVNGVSAKTIRPFIFEQEKIWNRCRWSKINDFTKGKVFEVVKLWLNPFCRQLMWLVSQRVFYWENFWYKYLSIISFIRHTSEWNLEKSETIENFQNNKVKIKQSLYCSEMRLLKFEYIPLNVGLWSTYI